MANKALSQLPDAGTLNGGELVLLTQGGASVKATLNAIKTLFGIGGKYVSNIGDGSAASFTLTHNLGTKDVTVTVYRNATPWDTVVCEVSRPTTNTVTLSGFGTAPSVDQFRVIIKS